MKKYVYHLLGGLAALLAGLMFACGLVVSAMTQPAKVIGFLNIAGFWTPNRFGAWDASLGFVMGGQDAITFTVALVFGLWTAKRFSDK